MLLGLEYLIDGDKKEKERDRVRERDDWGEEEGGEVGDDLILGLFRIQHLLKDTLLSCAN